MKLTRTAKLWFGVLFLVALVLSATFFWFSREPHYQGKPLSKWAGDIGVPFLEASAAEMDEAQTKAQEATEAIRQIGMNAIPIALNYCRAKTETELEARVKRWINSKDFLGIHAPLSGDKHLLATYIFKALGPLGKPAIPELVQCLGNKPELGGYAASQSLVYVGPDAIPSLIIALTDSDEQKRENAVRTLGGFRNQATTAVPDVTRCLKDRNPRVRQAAAGCLAVMGGETNIVIAALLDCLSDSDVLVREIGAISLAHFSTQPERIVPALLACMAAETTLPVISPTMVTALGRFGTNARPWSPILVQLIESNRFGTFAGSAVSALARIDPEAARPFVERRSNDLFQAQSRQAAKMNSISSSNTPPPTAR